MTYPTDFQDVVREIVREELAAEKEVQAQRRRDMLADVVPGFVNRGTEDEAIERLKAEFQRQFNQPGPSPYSATLYEDDTAYLDGTFDLRAIVKAVLSTTVAGWLLVHYDTGNIIGWYETKANCEIVYQHADMRTRCIPDRFSVEEMK